MISRFSNFAQRFIGDSGTRLLMDDLGEVLSSERHLCNLGGGNPAQIPEMQAVFRAHMQRLIDNGEFDARAGRYDGPRGHQPFLEAIAELLHATYGWNLGAENIVATTGSQSSFFMLFNLFSGSCADGLTRRVQLPLAPEYIGYTDISVESEAIVSSQSRIEHIDAHTFKYHLDFERLEFDERTGAVCVSRPTNPTGNVITDAELSRLVAGTRAAGIPLIIDNAYGVPFPDIVFSEAVPQWEDHIIYCMSLSKLGLPGLRTGIVVAQPQVVEAISSMNAIFQLASSGLGASLVTPMIESGEVLRLSREVIKPYYKSRVEQAVAWCHDRFEGLDFRIHKPEGAIFLWLWFPDLPITSAVLYERLKARGVLVIPGHYFFPGLDEQWQHKHECLRISYAQSAAEVEEGIGIIADEVRRAFDQSSV